MRSRRTVLGAYHLRGQICAPITFDQSSSCPKLIMPDAPCATSLRFVDKPPMRLNGSLGHFDEVSFSLRFLIRRQGLLKRNNSVYTMCLDRKVPLVITMGGGYSRPIMGKLKTLSTQLASRPHMSLLLPFRSSHPRQSLNVSFFSEREHDHKGPCLCSLCFGSRGCVPLSCVSIRCSVRVTPTRKQLFGSFILSHGALNLV